MKYLKYILAVLFFTAAVSSGAAVVLAEFNSMIRPAGPVMAFDLKEDGPGAFEVEFLGEKMGVKLLEGDTATDLFHRITAIASDFAFRAREVLEPEHLEEWSPRGIPERR